MIRLILKLYSITLPQDGPPFSLTTETRKQQELQRKWHGHVPVGSESHYSLTIATLNNHDFCNKSHILICSFYNFSRNRKCRWNVRPFIKALALEKPVTHLLHCLTPPSNSRCVFLKTYLEHSPIFHQFTSLTSI